ncbi:MAG: SDR family oxidoreductase [Spirochaetota bacterium]|nr:MAG: SDR family oxidoreductase [Spirochaetota bacterium]
MILDEFGVKGKVALVTGAGRGIGKAIALVMAEAGADVALIARTKEQLEQTAEEIRRLGRKTLVLPTDISQGEQVNRAVEKTISEFGKIDILCNNAAMLVIKPVIPVPEEILTEWQVPVDEGGSHAISAEEWHRVLETNVTGAFYFAQAVGPHMIKRKTGKVINISSTDAEEGFPCMSAYSVSKAALSSFTRVLASEWASFNINVNAVAPGTIITEFASEWLEDPKELEFVTSLIPLGRLGEPREVALLTLFLASEASKYITGQIFTIDGGAMGKGCGI